MTSMMITISSFLMSSICSLKKLDILKKEWARQHRLVEEYDRGQVQQSGKPSYQDCDSEWRKVRQLSLAKMRVNSQ
jgi:hypothetical protein